MPSVDTISIHALRKESDLAESVHRVGRNISIHALRKESDILGDYLRRVNRDFNPRSP